MISAAQSKAPSGQNASKESLGSPAFQAHLQGLRKIQPVMREIAGMEIAEAYFGSDICDKTKTDIQDVLQSIGAKLTSGQFTEQEVEKLNGGLSTYEQLLLQVLNDRSKTGLGNSREVYATLLATIAGCPKPSERHKPSEVADHSEIRLPQVEVSKPHVSQKDSSQKDFSNNALPNATEESRRRMSEFFDVNPSYIQDSGGVNIEQDHQRRTEQPSDPEQPPSPERFQNTDIVQPARTELERVEPPYDFRQPFSPRRLLDIRQPLDFGRVPEIRSVRRQTAQPPHTVRHTPTNSTNTLPPIGPMRMQHVQTTNTSISNTPRPSLATERRQNELLEREAALLLTQSVNKYKCIDSKALAQLMVGMDPDRCKRIIAGINSLASTLSRDDLRSIASELDDMRRGGQISNYRSGLRLRPPIA